MATKNPYTPKTLRELADKAEMGTLISRLGNNCKVMMPDDAPDALRWAAREIEKLRSKISWMFVRSRRKANQTSGSAGGMP